jgi:hypothetical protein
MASVNSVNSSNRVMAVWGGKMASARVAGRGGSCDPLDGLLDEIAGQVIQARGHGQLHGQLAQALELTEELKAGVGEPGMLDAGRVEGVPDEGLESVPVANGPQLHWGLDTAGQGGIGGPSQGMDETGVAEEPQGHQVTGVEGKVQKGG